MGLPVYVYVFPIICFLKRFYESRQCLNKSFAVRQRSIKNVHNESDFDNSQVLSTQFKPMFHFHIQWKRQKNLGFFLTFSGVQKWNIDLNWVNTLAEN